MSDDLMSIPIPGDDQREAWKKAQEALKGVQSEMKPFGPNRGAATSAAAYATGQSSWMNQPQFPSPYNVQPPVMMHPPPPSGGYPSFGGGFHPSTWNSSAIPSSIPPPPMNQNYNQQPFNYQQQPPQQWNNNGFGRGRGRGAKWNPHAPQNLQKGGVGGQQQQFQPFQLNKKNNGSAFPHLQNSFVPQNQRMGMGRGAGMNNGVSANQPPPSAMRYVQRAYEAANSQEEREKTEEYLKKRVTPMINAGTANNINWDNEPLPHERNYELPMWTPANQLPHQANGFHRKKSPPRRRSGDLLSESESTGGGGGPETKRSRVESGSTSDDSDIFEIMQNSKVLKNGKYLGSKMDKIEHHDDRNTRCQQDYLQKKKTKAEKKAEKAAKKATKKQKQQNKLQKNQWKVDYDDGHSRIEERARRFADSSAAPKPLGSIIQRFVRRGQVVKGTCQDIEKAFFRLTAAPDPAAVRPLEVLRLSLNNVKDKYRAKTEYQYLSSQLRSIRQDLTVQMIRNEFTVEVYEVNARISLERKDREEFNKCQSQLKLLYSEVENCRHQPEFVSYRLLYYIAMENLIDINSLLKELTPELKMDESVKFALDVRKAYSNGNFVKMFKLFQNDPPNMCAFLMDLFVERERKKALNTIIKGYKPTLSYAVIAKYLGWNEMELVEWLVEDLNVEDAEIGGSLDCRTARTF